MLVSSRIVRRRPHQNMGSAYLLTDAAVQYLLSYNLMLQKMNTTSNATNRDVFNPNAIKEFAMKMPEVSFGQCKIQASNCTTMYSYKFKTCSQFRDFETSGRR